MAQYALRPATLDLPDATDLHTPALKSPLKSPVPQDLPDKHIDREERAVAELLTRFRNLVTFAAMPAEAGATKEVAASHAFQMEVESIALVQAAEDLLQLTRELKELWLAGPLRELGEDEETGKMAEDAKKVGEMVNGLLKQASELRQGAGMALQ